MSNAHKKLQPNAWHSPPNARSGALRGIQLVSPSPEEAASLAAAAGESAAGRVKAYETPVTEETLRQKVS